MNKVTWLSLALGLNSPDQLNSHVCCVKKSNKKLDNATKKRRKANKLAKKQRKNK